MPTKPPPEETIQRAHAIANGVYVAAVNRIGHEGPSDGGLEFWGNSFLADPFGRIIARAGELTEEVVIAKCDPRLQDETRRNWPFLRDRRIDAYALTTPTLTRLILDTAMDRPLCHARFRMPAEWEPRAATWVTGRTAVKIGQESSRRFAGFTPRSVHAWSCGRDAFTLLSAVANAERASGRSARLPPTSISPRFASFGRTT